MSKKRRRLTPDEEMGLILSRTSIAKPVPGLDELIKTKLAGYARWYRIDDDIALRKLVTLRIDYGA